MKQFIVILGLVISVNHASAQFGNEYAIGIEINPNLVVPENKIDELNETQSEFNYSIGLVYSTSLNSRINLVTGINYTRISYSQKDYSTLFPSDFNPATGGPIIEKSWKEDFNDNYYLGIPLEVNIGVSQENKNLFLKLGYEYLFHAQSEINSVLFPCGVEDKLRVFELDNNNLHKLKFGLGYEIKTSSIFSLIIEPEFEYYVSKIHRDADLYSNSLVSFGINLKAMMNGSRSL